MIIGQGGKGGNVHEAGRAVSSRALALCASALIFAVYLPYQATVGDCRDGTQTRLLPRYKRGDVPRQPMLRLNLAAPEAYLGETWAYVGVRRIHFFSFPKARRALKKLYKSAAG